MAGSAQGVGDMTSGILATLAGLVAALGGLLLWAFKKVGQSDAAIDAWEKREKARKDAEDAASKERKATDGLDDDAIRGRLSDRRK